MIEQKKCNVTKETQRQRSLPKKQTTKYINNMELRHLRYL